MVKPDPLIPIDTIKQQQGIIQQYINTRTLSDPSDNAQAPVTPSHELMESFKKHIGGNPNVLNKQLKQIGMCLLWHLKNGQGARI